MIYQMIFPEIVKFKLMFSFSSKYNIHASVITLGQDLNAITYWVFQWKMIFNPDLSKQTKLRN